MVGMSGAQPDLWENSVSAAGRSRASFPTPESPGSGPEAGQRRDFIDHGGLEKMGRMGTLSFSEEKKMLEGIHVV